MSLCKKIMTSLQLLGQDQKGQAIFEFLVFIPFMMILYAILITISNAINGSINQQKITRGYYFNLVQNDSHLPTTEILQDFRSHSIAQVGIFAIGWRLRAENEQQVAPCYKILSLSKATSEEECSPGNREENSTQFIRVKTVFGICSSTYSLVNDQYMLSINVPGLLPV